MKYSGVSVPRKEIIQSRKEKGGQESCNSVESEISSMRKVRKRAMNVLRLVDPQYDMYGNHTVIAFRNCWH